MTAYMHTCVQRHSVRMMCARACICIWVNVAALYARAHVRVCVCVLQRCVHVCVRCAACNSSRFVGGRVARRDDDDMCIAVHRWLNVPGAVPKIKRRNKPIRDKKTIADREGGVREVRDRAARRFLGDRKAPGTYSHPPVHDDRFYE